VQADNTMFTTKTRQHKFAHMFSIKPVKNNEISKKSEFEDWKKCKSVGLRTNSGQN